MIWAGLMVDDLRKISDSEALRISLDTLKQFRSTSELEINSVIARHTLHAELGYFSDPQIGYGLDDSERDRLIAHGRQDAAYALLNTISLMKRQKADRFLIRAGVLLLFLTFVISVYGLYK